jgi:hypothetical protein
MTGRAPALEGFPAYVRIRPRWWLPPYVFIVIFLCALFDTEPHPQRFDYWMRRGLKIQVLRRGAWVTL